MKARKFISFSLMMLILLTGCGNRDASDEQATAEIEIISDAPDTAPPATSAPDTAPPATSPPITEPPATSPPKIKSENKKIIFLLNTATNCVHDANYKGNCRAVQSMLDENVQIIEISADELANYTNIYWACGICAKEYTDILPKF